MFEGFAKQPAKLWFERAEALHLTFALVQGIDDLLACPQLRRGIFSWKFACGQVLAYAADSQGIGSGCVYFGVAAQPGSFDRACFTKLADRVGSSFNGTWRARLELLRVPSAGLGLDVSD